MEIQKGGDVGECGTEVFKTGRSQQRGLGDLREATQKNVARGK